MKLSLRRRDIPVPLAAALAFVSFEATAQRGGQPPSGEQEGRLPNGKSQQDEILKAEHEQNLKDAAQLVDLSQQLREELEKNDRFVVSMGTVKKTDDIEKLVRKIRARL